MWDELMILAKIKEGDMRAFEKVFRRYYSPLCWYAASITGNVESAEEIVEELFYTLWKNREQLQIFRSLKSYLYRAVRNESIHYCEHQEVRQRYCTLVQEGEESGEPTDPHRQMEYKELQTVIQHALGKLSGRGRHIFTMHRVQGMKYAEIARTLSLSVKTVEAEMTKALRTLRNEIDHYILTK